MAHNNLPVLGAYLRSAGVAEPQPGGVGDTPVPPRESWKYSPRELTAESYTEVGRFSANTGRGLANVWQ